MLNSLFYVHQKRQEERTGKYGTPRLHYQQELVSQFQNATSEGMLCFNIFNILELFLDCIMEPNEKIVKFGIQQMLLLSLSVVGFLLSFNFYQVLLETL
ncbi:hypothetical protein CsSME_00037283 [Camellia sinensis var. sinensis]